MTFSRHTGLTLAAILVLLVVCGAYLRTVAFDDDEFQHAHVAWLIRNGQVPHADFFEHHFTAYHALLSVVFLPGDGALKI